MCGSPKELGLGTGKKGSLCNGPRKGVGVHLAAGGRVGFYHSDEDHSLFSLLERDNPASHWPIPARTPPSSSSAK